MWYVDPICCGLSKKNIVFLSAGHATQLTSAGTTVLLVQCTTHSHLLGGNGAHSLCKRQPHALWLGQRAVRHRPSAHPAAARVSACHVAGASRGARCGRWGRRRSRCALCPRHTRGSARPPRARPPCPLGSLPVSHGACVCVPAAGTMQSACVLCLSPFALCLRVCVCGPRPCAAPATPAPCPWLGRAGRPEGRRAGPRGGAGHRPPPNSPQRLARRRRRGGSLARRGPAPSPPGAAPLRAACESGLCRARAAAAAGADGQRPPRGSMEKAAGEGGGSNSSSRSSSRPTSAGSSPSSSSASRGLPGRAAAAGRLDGSGGGGSSSPGSAAASPGGAQAPGGGRRRESVLEGTLSKYTNLLQGWQSR